MPDRAEEAKEGLAAALADQDDGLAALHALRWALVWSVGAMGGLPDEAPRGESAGAQGRGGQGPQRPPLGAGEATGTGKDVSPRSSAETLGEPPPAGASARCLEAVFLLDDALTEAEDVSRAAVRLLARARPGPTAEAYLRDRERELGEVKRRTGAARADFDGLAEAEEELRGRLAEYAGLRERVAELRRLERLVEALDALSGQRAAVEERLAYLRSRTDGVEEAVARDGAELLRLTRDQLALLAPRARTALENAAAAQAELISEEDLLAGSEDRLTEVSARLAEVGVLRRERASALSARTRADRRLADALASLPESWHGSYGGGDGTAPERARALLDGVEERLRDVEEALRRGLDEEEGAPVPGRTVLAWGDEGPSGATAR